jgi:NAD(P)-dependent dehydrogenase (short-subunit alcohol dehydrogenase family)
VATQQPRAVGLVVGGVREARALVADELAHRGWGLALNYPSGRREAELRVQELRAEGVSVMGLFAGLDQEGTGAVLVRRVLADFGRLDAVVIDPPPPPAVPFERLDDRDLEEIVAAGVIGPHRVARAALEPLTRSGGRLVVVARAHGAAGALVGGGLAAWSAVLGQELAPAGIAVGCVAVGLPGERPAEGAVGEQAVARGVLGLLLGERPAPGARVDVAAPLSSRP